MLCISDSLYRYISLLCSTALLLLSCEPKQPDLDVNTETLIYDRSGAIIRVVDAEPIDFFVTIEAPSTWTLSSSSPEWLTVSLRSGSAGRQEVIVSIARNESGERQATLTLSTTETIATYTITQQQSSGYVGGDSKYGYETILGDVSLLESPKLSGRSTAYYITHRVEQGQRVNYSVEYDVAYRHPIWVCYSADDYTSQRRTSRSDAWGWDPLVPSQYEVTRSDFNGYNRGHMVASADRLFSQEANIQTFYYTNMSPQRDKHNTGIWVQLEQLVQSWARNSHLRDQLYIAKGGTLREGETIDTTPGGITVPRYYWMAILAEKGGDYQAIAFWTDHKQPAKVSRPRTLAISIDQLEERTGLDFFHNLPDKVEQEVEAIHPEVSSWPGI